MSKAEAKVEDDELKEELDVEPAKELTQREISEAEFYDIRKEKKRGFYFALSNSFFLTYAYFFSLIILFFAFFFLTPRDFLERIEWRGEHSLLACYYLFLFVPILYVMALLFQITLYNWQKIKPLRYRMQMLGFFSAAITFTVLFFAGY